MENNLQRKKLEIFASHQFALNYLIFCSIEKMAPSTKSQPEQQLNLDALTSEEQNVCFDLMFDYLGLDDLVSVGRTCKQLHGVASEYFVRNYPFAAIRFGENSNGKIVHEINGNETNFGAFAQCLLIWHNDINIYRFVAANKYENLQKIEFKGCVQFSPDHHSIIAKMKFLANVSTVVFNGCSPLFRDNVLDFILKFSTNINTLIMKDTHDGRSDLDWIHRRSSTLEGLEIHDNIDLCAKDLKKFLRANPQIKRLSVPFNKSILQLIETNDMKLDELELRFDWSSYTARERNMCDRINGLAGKGHIKHFKPCVNCGTQPPLSSLNSLNDIECFSSMKLSCQGNTRCMEPIGTSLTSFVNLRKLEVDFDEFSADDADLLSRSLVALEEIDLGNNSLRLAEPFSRRLSLLHIIKSASSDEYIIDVAAWNRGRKKLPFVRKLKIFVSDEAYDKIRWTSAKLLCDMVEIRRLNQLN